MWNMGSVALREGGSRIDTAGSVNDTVGSLKHIYHLLEHGNLGCMKMNSQCICDPDYSNAVATSGSRDCSVRILVELRLLPTSVTSIL